METNLNLLSAGSLDDLLLAAIEKNQHQPDYQKSIDMTARVLFEDADSLVLPGDRRSLLLARYPDFKASWWTRDNFFRLFVGLSGITAILLYFVAMRNPVQILHDSPNFNAPAILADTTTQEADHAETPVAEHFAATRTVNTEINQPQEDSLKINKNSEHAEVYQPQLKGEAIGKMPEITAANLWDQDPFQDDKIEIQTGNYELVLRNYFVDGPEDKPVGLKSSKAPAKAMVSGSSEKTQSSAKPKNEPYELFVYTGKPFKKVLDFMVFINQNPENIINSEDKNADPAKNISSLHFSLPVSMLFQNLNDEEGRRPFDAEKLENSFFQPFYIMKTEVSNLDYREFVYWVIRMNGYQTNNLVKFEDLPAEAFLYQFHSIENEYVVAKNSRFLSVLPKQAAWSADFPFSFNEPMDQYYFSHPAYHSYPVIGVSYWQSLAYLDWLSWIWQSRLDARNIPYEIKFDLPYDYERELAIEFYQDQNEQQAIQASVNEQLISSLAVVGMTDTELRMQLGMFSFDKLDENIYTCPVDQSYVPQKNKSQLYNLDGNVSEWCKDGYAGSYEDWKVKYRALLAADSSSMSQMLLELDDYFMKTANNQQGKLVRGANFYDQRFDAGKQDKRSAFYAKAFVHPDEQHATIGFRAVARVKLKNDSEIKLKMSDNH